MRLMRDKHGEYDEVRAVYLGAALGLLISAALILVAVLT